MRPWGPPCPPRELAPRGHSGGDGAAAGATPDSLTALRVEPAEPTRFPKVRWSADFRPAPRWSAGDAGNPLRFKKLGVVARGGIEPPTRGFSVPVRAHNAERCAYKWMN